MSELVPARTGSLIGPLTDPAGGSALTRIGTFTAQPAIRRTLPWLGGLGAVVAVALTWSLIASAPQRILYSELDDGERAQVVAALDKAAIAYRIDNQTGTLTVDENELYRARMLVASDGALASPASGSDMLDSLPLGASRTMEGTRLRAAREHDLMLTVMEIDGVESARVHLAEADKSPFVRDNVPPTASVMVRLARGRQLSDSQVTAVINLVAGSVPGLSVDAVKIVDQHGRLLSDTRGKGDNDRLALQARMEEKLRMQLDQLLAPILGAGNFSSEIQVELDMDQITSARESYDKNGVVRSETQEQSQSAATGSAGGIPGVLSNTPPPAATASPGPPLGTPTAAAAPGAGESSTSRTYELGREVAVANTSPGKVKRISVAVALSRAAMKQGKAADVEQLKQLVSAAVGADPARGDQVAVIIRTFEPGEVATLAFYEAPWFATLVRSLVALLAVLLVLLLGVRPLIRAFKRESRGESASVSTAPQPATIDPALLNRQVGLAQQMVAQQPDSAVIALRQMLAQPGSGA